MLLSMLYLLRCQSFSAILRMDGKSWLEISKPHKDYNSFQQSHL